MVMNNEYNYYNLIKYCRFFRVHTNILHTYTYIFHCVHTNIINVYTNILVPAFLHIGKLENKLKQNRNGLENC